MYFNKFSIFFVILCMFCSYIYAQPKSVNPYVATEFVESYGANSLVQLHNDIAHEQTDNTTQRLALNAGNQINSLEMEYRVRRVDAGFRNGWINPVDIPSTINQIVFTRININDEEKYSFYIHTGDKVILIFYNCSAIVFMGSDVALKVTVISDISGIFVSVVMPSLPRLECWCYYDISNINIANFYYALNVMRDPVLQPYKFINEAEILFLLHRSIEHWATQDLKTNIKSRNFLVTILQCISIVVYSKENQWQLIFATSYGFLPIKLQLFGNYPNEFSILGDTALEFYSFFESTPAKRVSDEVNQRIINFLLLKIKNVNP